MNPQEIIDKYPDDRVLVHTVNSKVRDYLLNSLPQQRLISHTTNNREEMLETFRLAKAPLVMISPSFDRGIDLYDDQCRCVIIAKMPYLDLSDKQVKARMALPGGQRWYNLRTAQTLVQMSGRAVRSKTDHADTWILDRQFESVLMRTRHILPKWWLAAIKRIG